MVGLTRGTTVRAITRATGEGEQESVEGEEEEVMWMVRPPVLCAKVVAAFLNIRNTRLIKTIQ